MVVRGADTVLGDAASATEVFLTQQLHSGCAQLSSASPHGLAAPLLSSSGMVRGSARLSSVLVLRAAGPGSIRAVWCRPLSSVQSKLDVQRPSAAWNMQKRNADWERSAAAEAAAAAAPAAAEPAGAKGRAREPDACLLRSLYLPDQGMFCQINADLQLGQRLPVRPAQGCWAC